MLLSSTKALPFYYGSLQHIPTHRLSSDRILRQIQAHRITSQLINNTKIAINCTRIAIRYSRCYLCKNALFRYPIKRTYRMDEQERVLARIDKLFVQQCPIPKFAPLFKRFDYDGKGIYAAFSLVQSESLTLQQQEQAVKFLTALELVNLGFSLHHSVGKSHKLNFVTRVALKMMSKQMKDSYLVLGGDYFHIKGSVLASQTQSVELSKLLSEVQIDLCKYVHLTQQLKGKILSRGYDKVEVKEIFDISALKSSPIVKGLMAMDVIKDTANENDDLRKEAYEIIGLLTMYRRDLENFMFNFKDIVKKYLEYSTNRINFDSEQSLPYYIFFQGAQEQKRIDISYLNTVTMMSEQIQFLQEKLKTLLGETQAKQLEKKMNYFLMIYS